MSNQFNLVKFPSSAIDDSIKLLKLLNTSNVEGLNLKLAFDENYYGKAFLFDEDTQDVYMLKNKNEKPNDYILAKDVIVEGEHLPYLLNDIFIIVEGSERLTWNNHLFPLLETLVVYEKLLDENGYIHTNNIYDDLVKEMHKFFLTSRDYYYFDMLIRDAEIILYHFVETFKTLYKERNKKDFQGDMSVVISEFKGFVIDSELLAI